MTSLVVAPAHFGAVVWDAVARKYFSFDEASARMLFALARREPLHDGARAFVRMLDDRGWLRFDGGLDARVIDKPAPDGRLLGPLLVHVEVNAVCNLACAHCFAAPLPRRDVPLSVAELDGLFAQMAALGSMRVSLTGGEPLLRADLLDVIDAAVAHGLSVSVTTNGLLLDEDIASALASRPLEWLNVSLDGATAATNDAVRGDGVFGRVLERLARVRDVVPFSLAFTLMKTNLHEVDAAIDLAARVGARSAIFRPLYPVGAASDRPDLWPDAADVAAVFARIRERGEEGGACGVAIESRGACGAGQTIASFDVAGRSSPCGFLGPAFLGASIRSHPLEDIWAMHHFAVLRDDDGGRGYHGGCRARAQTLRGSAFAADPWSDSSARTRGRPLPIIGSAP